eukprot:ctg_340.g233
MTDAPLTASKLRFASSCRPGVDESDARDPCQDHITDPCRPIASLRMFCTFTGTLRTGAVRRWRWLPGGCSAADAAWIAAKRTALQRPWLTCTPRRLLPSASFHSSRLRCSTPSDRSPRGQTTESPVQPGAPVDDANTNVIRALESRGLIESVTSDEIYALCRRPVSVYVGFDPTADSLHVGNLLGLLVLRWFQRFGHKPVAVMGGATARIGDPSGKSTERPLLDQHTIERNLRGIEGNLRQVLEFTGDAARFTEPLVLNNYDWLSRFSFLDFLRDVGKLARVVAGIRFRVLVLRARRDHPGGRLGSVGQHRDRHRDDPQVVRRQRVRTDVSAADHQRRAQAGQERERCGVAGAGPAEPVRVLPVSVQGVRRGRVSVPAAADVSAAGAGGRAGAFDASRRGLCGQHGATPAGGGGDAAGARRGRRAGGTGSHRHRLARARGESGREYRERCRRR